MIFNATKTFHDVWCEGFTPDKAFIITAQVINNVVSDANKAEALRELVDVYSEETRLV